MVCNSLFSMKPAAETEAYGERLSQSPCLEDRHTKLLRLDRQLQLEAIALGTCSDQPTKLAPQATGW
jgi:hypothetical protein